MALRLIKSRGDEQRTKWHCRYGPVSTSRHDYCFIARKRTSIVAAGWLDLVLARKETETGFPGLFTESFGERKLTRTQLRVFRERLSKQSSGETKRRSFSFPPTGID